MEKSRKRGRPRKKKKDLRSITIHSRITEERKKVIEHHARINAKSISDIINDALDLYFETRNTKLGGKKKNEGKD